MVRLKLLTLIANTIWFAFCIPGTLYYLLAAVFPRAFQRRLLIKLLHKNKDSAYGQRHGFDRIHSIDGFKNIPMTDYSDYAGDISRLRKGEESLLTTVPVTLLEPTSGSTSASKLIPYTDCLSKQFRAALAPWLGLLFLNRPELLTGAHYWSVSPATQWPGTEDDQIPIGFADDSEYLGIIGSFVAAHSLAVPSWIREIRDKDALLHTTLLFLVRRKDLRLMSVWHPSFLLILVDYMSNNWATILADLTSGGIDPKCPVSADLRERLREQLPPIPSRATELSTVRPGHDDWLRTIWPRLSVISCWCDGNTHAALGRLEAMFGHADIQPKGLLATEGVVSFPAGMSGGVLPAITSHYLEFIDADGIAHGIMDLRTDTEYSVVITTGGGLYRYKLHDRIQITGKTFGLPNIQFLGRDNVCSDLVGEKLSGEHVEEILRNVPAAFCMLAPEPAQEPGYVCYVAGSEDDIQPTVQRVKAGLQDNYHYHHAVRLGQLKPLRVVILNGDGHDCYRNWKLKQGVRLGDIKFPALELNGDVASAFGDTIVMKETKEPV